MIDECHSAMMEGDPGEGEVRRVAGFTIKYGDVPMNVAAASPEEVISEVHIPEGNPFEEMIERNAADNIESHLGGDLDNRLSVVLDAEHIGRFGSDCGSRDIHASFQVSQLVAAINYFERYGLRVISFIPAAMVRRRPYKGDDDKSNARMQTTMVEQLNHLISNGKVTVVPSGDEDDLYVLSYSRRNHCFIVSNDFFHDHIRRLSRQDESLGRSMKLWIDENKCTYTFVGSEFVPSPATSLMRTLEALESRKEGPLGDLQSAVSELDRAVAAIARVRIQAGAADKAHPALSLALQARAELLLDAGEEQAAMRDLTKIREIPSSSPLQSQNQVR